MSQLDVFHVPGGKGGGVGGLDIMCYTGRYMAGFHPGIFFCLGGGWGAGAYN